MATLKNQAPFQSKINIVSAAMAIMMAVYLVLLLVTALTSAGSLSAFLAAFRITLLGITAGIGTTFIYMRQVKKVAPVRSAGATVDKSGPAAFKREVESWIGQLADAVKTKTAFSSLTLTPEVEDLKNHSKLNTAFKALLTELDNLKKEKQNEAAAIEQKEKQAQKLEELVLARNAEIGKLKKEMEAVQRQTEEQKRNVAQLTLELSNQAASMEKQKKDMLSRVERYRNISKFLEQAKSTLYSQHGPGQEFLVQLKLGLLADDAINLSNKNDYHSLNYELFRNGRPFSQLVKEQPPTHIDAYPESVKKLRQWIRAAGFEQEDWNMFYQNYPVTDKQGL